MGTLFNQRPRMDTLNDERIISMGNSFKRIAKELNITFDEAINLYLAVAKIDDYDAKDEQLSGFATLIKESVEDIFEYKQQMDSDVADEKFDLLKESTETLRWLREILPSYLKQK